MLTYLTVVDDATTKSVGIVPARGRWIRAAKCVRCPSLTILEALVFTDMSQAVFRASSLAVITLAASCALASAQSPSPPADPTRCETEVVVTAERSVAPVNQVPASVIVIGKEKLQTLPVVQLAEVLSYVPGLSLMQGQFYAGRPVDWSLVSRREDVGR